MNDGQLAELFGWWWRDPAKALHGKFRYKFQSFEHDYQLQLAAFDYELASRAEEGEPRYLLDKRFDKLSYKQMCGVMDMWERGPQESAHAPFIAYRYQETPLELQASPITEEQEWATRTGWIPPRYFKFNLRQFGNDAILEELREWLKAERIRLSLDAPKGGHPSSKRKSFHAVECIDVWRLPPDKRPKEDRHGRAYGGGQKRRAVGEAKKLRAEWAKAVKNASLQPLKKASLQALKSRRPRLQQP